MNPNLEPSRLKKTLSIGEKFLGLVIWLIPLPFLYKIFKENLTRFSCYYYDEAIAYWIARGIDILSNPFHLTPKTSPLDTINLCARYEVTPPGFTLLLRFWEQIGAWAHQSLTAHLHQLPFLDLYAWPRLLPWICTGTLCYFSGLIGRQICKTHPNPLPNPITHLFTGFCLILPFTFPQITRAGLEVRPYIYEGMFVAILWYFLERACQSSTQRGSSPWKPWLAVGVISALGLYSRYSFILFAASAGFIGTLHLLFSQPFKIAIQRIGLFALPQIISLTLLVWFVLYPQGYIHTPIAFRGPAFLSPPPELYQPFLLGAISKPEIIATFKENFLSIHLQTLFISIFLGLALPLTLLLLLPNKTLKALRQNLPLGPFQRLLSLTLLISTLYPALSYANKFPWNAAQRWSTPWHVLSILCAIGSFALFLKLFQILWKHPQASLTKKGLKTLLIFIPLCLAWAFTFQPLRAKAPWPNNLFNPLLYQRYEYNPNQKAHLQQIFYKQNDPVYIDNWQIPEACFQKHLLNRFPNPPEKLVHIQYAKIIKTHPPSLPEPRFAVQALTLQNKILQHPTTFPSTPEGESQANKLTNTILQRGTIQPNLWEETPILYIESSKPHKNSITFTQTLHLSDTSPKFWIYSQKPDTTAHRFVGLNDGKFTQKTDNPNIYEWKPIVGRGRQYFLLNP